MLGHSNCFRLQPLWLTNLGRRLSARRSNRLGEKRAQKLKLGGFRPSVQPGNFFRAAEGKLPFTDAPKHPSIPPCSNITTSTTVVYLNGDADAASLRIVLHLQCAGLAEAVGRCRPNPFTRTFTAPVRPGSQGANSSHRRGDKRLAELIFGAL